MVVFPNCKINLGLHVVSKRKDGYHNIETIFYPVPLKDALEIIPSETKTIFTASGIPIDAHPENNLCTRAYQLMAKSFYIPPVKIHLHKLIPYGAGLGGGSSNAAFTINTLDKLFELDIPTKQKLEIASKIGADCAFFIQNKAIMAKGIGNIFSEVSLNLTGYYFVIVKPGFGISTKEAYSGVRINEKVLSLDEIVAQPINKWKDLLTNDFEPHIMACNPEIKTIKQKLYNYGAVYASMSGSGSAVYGLFDKKIDVKELFLKKDFFVFQSYL